MKSHTYRARLQSIRSAMTASGFDALFVVIPANVRYLSGFWGYSSRTEYLLPRRLTCLVVTQNGDPTLVVPKIERRFATVTSLVTDIRHHIEWKEEGECDDSLRLLAQILQEKGVTRGSIGVELDLLTLKMVEFLKMAFGNYTLLSSTEMLSKARMVKDQEEISILRRSGEMVVAEFEEEVSLMREGVREFELAEKGRSVATRLNAVAMEADEMGTHEGLSPLADGIQIVTSGPRLEMPHGLASLRTVQKNDIVAFDFCRVPQYLAYRVGFGRVVSLRPLSREEQGIEKVIGQAYQRALAVVKPGTKAADIDHAAREVITKAGYGSYFVHRTGRGVGIDLIELPDIWPGDQTPLQAGMVITIEPSIYMPGFQARVEDTLLVTDNGYEILTDSFTGIRILNTR